MANTLANSDRAQVARRGHTSQISISDKDHHVTEAIGGMYDSEDDEHYSSTRPTSRPLSYVFQPKEAYIMSTPDHTNDLSQTKRLPLQNTAGNERLHISDASHEIARKTSLDSENIHLRSPTTPTADAGDVAVQQFPLNDIDYESSPAAVAQELSNLHAIRRMSMSVDTADPDLPSFSSAYSSPPSPNADEDDASRMFWVPASLHPELAPTEFKDFLEQRVSKMRRLSDDGRNLLPGMERSESGITRKKSMLSRQVNPVKINDNTAQMPSRADSNASSEHGEADESHLARLAIDPTGLLRKLSIDSSRKSQDSGVSLPGDFEAPVPGSFGGLGLKRSTRTNYRKGSLRKGEKVPLSKRAIERNAERGHRTETGSPLADEPESTFTEKQTEPVASVTRSASDVTDNFSRPGRNKQQGLGISTSADDLSTRRTEKPSVQHRAQSPVDQSVESNRTSPTTSQEAFRSRIAHGGRTTARRPDAQVPIPQIVETPPSTERPAPGSLAFPARGSSRGPPPLYPPQQAPRPVPLINSARSRQQPESTRNPHGSTLDDISSNPSLLPGSGSTRTDDLTMVPTFEHKKNDKKESTRKTSWGWFLGGDDKKDDKDREAREKDKDREKKRLKEDKIKEEETEKERLKEREKARKPLISSRLASSDKTRLDVLQSSIDGTTRGRESVVLDRESIKLDDERKKESSRTRSSNSAPKKERGDGILSAIFGGSKKSKDDGSKKRSTSRGLSPEVRTRVLRSDLDYHWTRFSILEERAIYRLAHIKLANPRRALHSQVLLSNFMYSYLAKVQLMHPQVQFKASQPAAPPPQKSKKSEHERSEDFLQYQQWHDVSCLLCW